jgi:hypothetical protein
MMAPYISLGRWRLAVEGAKELTLDDMVDMGLNEGLKFPNIHPLQHTKTVNVQRLGEI